MKYESEIFNLMQNKEWEKVAPGMKRRFMGYDDNIMMVQVHFEKDAIGARHKHFHSQTTYVVSGKFQITIGENKQLLEAGDGFYAPPNVEHEALCLEEGILIDVFSPIREDFMKGVSGYTK